MIVVEDLRYDYPGTRALDGLSFRLEAGSVTALVGPNGAGKTTLLRCLAGLETAHGGRVLLNGIDVGVDPRGAHQRLGYLPDHFGVYGELTARRCLLHAGASRGLRDAALEQRLAEVSARVGLVDRLDVLAGSLSRGQRQRLALAQAILHRPKVLLLDEPASGLDPEARAGLADLLRSLAAEGMCLVVSSHILAELETYCTGMLVLSHGRIVEDRRAAGAAEAAPDRPQRLLRIRLARPATDTDAERLRRAAIERLQSVSVSAAVLHAQTALADGALPALLRELLDAGLPVCEFGIAEESLQQRYLAAIRETA